MKLNTQSILCFKSKTSTSRKKDLHIVSILCRLSKLGHKSFKLSANPTIPKYVVLILQPLQLSPSSAIKACIKTKYKYKWG